jgi:hypothetical protein
MRPLADLILLGSASKLCNFIEWKDGKVIYKRYASLYFVCMVDKDDNELMVLETVHHFVEILDRYFGNVRLLVAWSASADCHACFCRFASST